MVDFKHNPAEAITLQDAPDEPEDFIVDEVQEQVQESYETYLAALSTVPLHDRTFAFIVAAEESDAKIQQLIDFARRVQQFRGIA